MTANSRRPTLSLGFGIAQPKTDTRKNEPDRAAPEVRKAKILVVDQDPAQRRVMVNRLGLADYALEALADAQSALDSCVRSRPNLVIVDLPLKDADGLTFLRELKSRWPQLTVIIVTAHGSIPEAVKATQCGAFGYLVRPVEKEELLGQVSRAVAASTFALTSESWPANLVSRNQLMQDRLAIANRAAASDEPILLTGEQGVGKELLARAIHAASARRSQSFLVVSCREQPTESVAKALFGHESGAASDEEPQTPGAWQRARAGTLLIEGIDQMPPPVQPMLLKALARDRSVRLICTTSTDLQRMVQAGTFLKNLHDEISILPIEIPPLGRRREDIPLLVSHFLEQAVEPGGRKKIYAPRAIELLATSDWPGNVRQLFDLVKQNIALSSGKVMTENFVQDSLGAQSAKIPTYDEARDSFARDYLEQSLQRTAGNVTQAARLAKRNRSDFYKLLARYRLDPEHFKNTRAEWASPKTAMAKSGEPNESAASGEGLHDELIDRGECGHSDAAELE